MNSNNGGDPVQPQVLTQEALTLLGEGISLVLSRWTALQMAIEEEWGGRDSRQKSDHLVSDILSWFAQTQETHYIDDLENILDECMVLSFNTEIEDGSVEEIAEKLMIMHEDCLQGNFESVEKLRNTCPVNGVSQSRQVGCFGSLMEMLITILTKRIQRWQLIYQNLVARSRPKAKIEPESVDDGWTVVPSRRNMSKK